MIHWIVTVERFEDWTSPQRDEVLKNKTTTELLVQASDIRFEEIEAELSGIAVDRDFEMPPLVNDDKQLLEAQLRIPDGQYGRWIHTLLAVYKLGGRVYYRRYDENSFVMTLSFDQVLL